MLTSYVIRDSCSCIVIFVTVVRTLLFVLFVYLLYWFFRILLFVNFNLAPISSRSYSC